jgi:NADH dehydrogenase [ubiquinone] 1 alpha subcomplex assembly factor 7
MTPPGTTLAERLTRRIRLTGPMTVADYMREALADPEQGYYRRDDPLGVAGDFTTAPEISQMFGEMIGLWCVDVWSRMGAPSPLRLVELGPGRGTLMADALRAARLRPEFGAAVDLHLVEISETLRARQAETLRGAPLGTAPTWHDDFATVPNGPLLLIANEFFDALPVHQFERTPEGWRERVVATDPEGDRRFRFALAPPGPAIGLLGPDLLEPERQAAPVGSVAEVSPAGIALAEAIGRRLATFGGAALIVDYGYGAGVMGDSLQALRRHRRHDPLVEPGCADITAHVDFAALGRAARGVGAVVRGPVPQGPFLDRLGLRLRAATLLDRATPEQARDIHAAVERLLEPTQMGTLFKALAITSAGLPIPAGFETPGTATSP